MNCNVINIEVDKIQLRYPKHRAACIIFSDNILNDYVLRFRDGGRIWKIYLHCGKPSQLESDEMLVALKEEDKLTCND